MPSNNKGFHLFSSSNTLVKVLAVAGLKVPQGDMSKCVILIERVKRNPEGKCVVEESNIQWSFFAATSTILMRDLFLTENFGVRCSFTSELGRFEFSGASKTAADVDGLQFFDMDLNSVKPTYHFETGPCL